VHEEMNGRTDGQDFLITQPLHSICAKKIVIFIDECHVIRTPICYLQYTSDCDIKFTRTTFS